MIFGNCYHMIFTNYLFKANLEMQQLMQIKTLPNIKWVQIVTNYITCLNKRLNVADHIWRE